MRDSKGKGQHIPEVSPENSISHPVSCKNLVQKACFEVFFCYRANKMGILIPIVMNHKAEIWNRYNRE